MVVEDDRVDRREIECLLTQSQLAVSRILHAKTLEEVLHVLESESPDVLLVDLNLPDSSGVDTVDAIHAHSPALTLVVVTGEDNHALGLQAVAHGAQDYLIKGQIFSEGLAKTIGYALERKKSEAALRQERDFAERVIETTQAIVLVLDTDMGICRFNSYMRSLCGYELHELQERNWLEVLIGPEYHAAFRETFAATLKQACGLGLVKTLTTKDGRGRFIEWTTSALHDSRGQVIGVLATGQDITERQQAQEATQSQAVFFQTLLAAVPCPMFYKDCAGRFLGANRAFQRISGRGLDRIVGRTVRDIWPCCHELHEQRDRVLLANPGNQQYEAQLESLDGSVRDVVVCKSTYTDAQGQVTGIIGALLDFTHRSEAEAAMREANANLEQANRDLKEMHAQVVQTEKLASIGQLAAGVAHEMNTPIGFVASNFETLQKYVRKLTDQLKAYQGLLDTLSPSAEIAALRKQTDASKLAFILADIDQLFAESQEGLSRVTSIVQNLRDFSRVSNEEVLEPFNINDGIRATLIVARNAIKYDADVVLELGEIPPIPCVSGQLNQVFLNIVVNAAQAIKMQERPERGTIVVRTVLRGDDVVCEIEDNGPGIPPETLKRIFDPFFTTKPVGKGTGLGLSVSYDIIVKKHHGRIDVTSEVGKGTCFHIVLPCQLPEDGSSADVHATVQEEAR